MENKSKNIVLMIDNSELEYFRESFNFLHHHGAFIAHHYGSVYGQLGTTSCTSFVTLHPSLIVAKSPSPYTHDQRWGHLNFQF